MIGKNLLVVLGFLAIAQSKSILRQDVDEQFQAMHDELNKAVDEALVNTIDKLEPEYQAVLAALKNGLNEAIAVLDATERNALIEVEEAAAGAAGTEGVDACVNDDRQKMLSVSEDARRESEDCVGLGIHTLDLTYENGVQSIKELKQISKLYDALYATCELDSCKAAVIKFFRQELDDLPAQVKIIQNKVGENMAHIITSTEVRCFEEQHQGLRVALREIVDNIEKCIAGLQ